MEGRIRGGIERFRALPRSEKVKLAARAALIGVPLVAAGISAANVVRDRRAEHAEHLANVAAAREILHGGREYDSDDSRTSSVNYYTNALDTATFPSTFHGVREFMSRLRSDEPKFGRDYDETRTRATMFDPPTWWTSTASPTSGAANPIFDPAVPPTPAPLP